MTAELSPWKGTSPCRSSRVEHGSERERVGAVIKFAGTDLLGRHVGHGPEHRSGTGEVYASSSVAVFAAAWTCVDEPAGTIHFGEAEVEDFCMATFGDEDVGGA